MPFAAPSLGMLSCLVLCACLAGCASCPAPRTDDVRSAGSERDAHAGDRAPIDVVLDDWHAAAAESDEARYFGHLTEDAIFLGTDATERWDPRAFRDYAHPAFDAGRGWRMRSIRRDVVVRDDVAWFDEDLDAVNLGAARGSGVLVRETDGRWRIAQYNLAITVPNARFDEVRALLRGTTDPAPPR